MSRIRTRFAPSPSGYLHLGHAYSAILNYRKGTEFLLRIEDIDHTRCRPEFSAAIFEDLNWLGIRWPEPVRYQSQHMDDYQNALDKLDALGVLYPCFCTRREIANEIEDANNAPHGPDGFLYPGTCRDLGKSEQDDLKASGQNYGIRLNVEKALSLCSNLYWEDERHGMQEATPEIFGDVILARKDIATSYHLSVCVDDHIQDIDLVIRGEDLFQSTHIHRLLQALLGLRTPVYHHHRLIIGEDGKRFAKRDKSLTLKSLRETGHEVDDLLLGMGL